MEITSNIVDTPPRDAATVLVLRQGQQGLEVLMLKRHSDSKDLGGVFVFPGGKRDEADGTPEALAAFNKVDVKLLHAQLGEPQLAPTEHAASLFIAALREAEEECGLQMQASDLQAWSRWITPRMPSMMSKRFDTRFFWRARPTLKRLFKTTTRPPKFCGPPLAKLDSILARRPLCWRRHKS
jgi:8-oxo-dGTP pyrophosphatase MutT (NUDIX family)